MKDHLSDEATDERVLRMAQVHPDLFGLKSPPKVIQEIPEPWLTYGRQTATTAMEHALAQRAKGTKQ